MSVSSPSKRPSSNHPNCTSERKTAELQRTPNDLTDSILPSSHAKLEEEQSLDVPDASHDRNEANTRPGPNENEQKNTSQVDDVQTYLHSSLCKVTQRYPLGPNSNITINHPNHPNHSSNPKPNL